MTRKRKGVLHDIRYIVSSTYLYLRICTPADGSWGILSEGKREDLDRKKITFFSTGNIIEFDYSIATRLVIDDFGLLQVGRERAINVTASIDAARLTKNICHTSAGLKMTDPGGFDVDGGRLQDMQSQK